jgi:predicted enzyme related to lactoylglutathione lyase
MARLRHIAIVVSDKERAAQFYEKVFDMKRVGEEDAGGGSAIYMSDGVINLALLNYKSDAMAGIEDSKNFVGTHHFGFQVDDLGETQEKIEENGGVFHFDLGEDEEEVNFEKKFRDPDGIIFDVSKSGWIGTDGVRK